MEYGLIDDPSADISDTDLRSEIERIRQLAPFSGVSMISGSLRAKGIRVSRERIMRLLDPISSALRSPSGLTKRRPYSVAGPNSLWHIGRTTVTACAEF